MKKMKKLISALTLCSMIFSVVSVPTLAADIGDFVINRVWMSNQAWEGGEELDILVSWRYAGSEQISESTKTPITVTNLSGLSYKYVDNLVSLQSKSFPQGVDQISRINSYIPNSKNISFTLNIRGNEYPVSLSSLKGKSDAEVIRLEASPMNFAVGDDVALYVWMKNEGTETMKLTSADVHYTVNGTAHIAKINETILPGERKKVYVDSFVATAAKMNVNLQFNPDGRITEGNYDNNCGYITLCSHENGDWIWDNVVHHGGGCVRHVHTSENTGTYMRTDMGGIYKFDYDFEKWIPLTMDIKKSKSAAGEPQRIIDPSGLAVAPGPDGEDILLVTDGSFRVRGDWEAPQLLRSFDSGKTWEAIVSLPVSVFARSSKTANSIEFDPNNPNVAWLVGYAEGVWYSENVLDTVPVWHKVELPGYQTEANVWGTSADCGYVTVGFDKTSASNGKTQTIYIATDLGGIYRSLDGGKSFAHMSNSPAGVFEFAEGNDGRVYAAATYKEGYDTHGVWRINSGEDSWTRTYRYTKSNKTNFTYFGLDVAPWDDDTVGIVIMTQQWSGPVIVSQDGGKKWTDIVEDSDYKTHNWWSNNGRPAYPSYFAFDPYIKGRVFFGDSCWSIDDIYASTRILRDRIYGLEELAIRDVVKPKGASSLYFAHNDGGFSKSTDMFSYESVNTGKFTNSNNTHTLDYCASNPEWVVVGGSRDWYEQGPRVLAYSKDGAVTMTNIQPMRYETTDPETGEKVNDGASVSNLAVSASLNQSGVPTIVAYSTAGVFQRTADLGTTWEDISCGFTPNYYGFDGNRALVSDKLNNGVFYVMDKSSGVLYKSTDDGKSFNPVSEGWNVANSSFDIYSMVFEDGLLWGTETGLQISRDGGASFRTLENVQSVDNIGSGIGKNTDSPEVIYIVGTANHEYGVHMSEDGGQTWKTLTGYGTDSIGWFGDGKRGIDGDKERYGVVYAGTGGMGVVVGMARESDFRPIEIALDDTIQTVSRTEEYLLKGKVSTPTSVSVNHNGSVYTTYASDDGTFEQKVKLSYGTNNFVISAQSGNSKKATEEYKVLYYPDYSDISAPNGVTPASLSSKCEIKVTDKAFSGTTKVNSSGFGGIFNSTSVGGALGESKWKPTAGTTFASFSEKNCIYVNAEREGTYKLSITTGSPYHGANTYNVYVNDALATSKSFTPSYKEFSLSPVGLPELSVKLRQGLNKLYVTCDSKDSLWTAITLEKISVPSIDGEKNEGKQVITWEAEKTDSAFSYATDEELGTLNLTVNALKKGDYYLTVYNEGTDNNNHTYGVVTVNGTDTLSVISTSPFKTTITNSSETAVYAVSVNYTATKYIGATKTMTLSVAGEKYTHTLPALTAGTQATEVFYVRVFEGESSVVVAADEAFAVTGITAESKSEATYQAETDATMVSGEKKPNASNCTYIWNNVQLNYNIVYPAGTYNIKVNGASVYGSKVKVKILDMDGNVLSQSEAKSLGYIGGMRLPEEGEFALVDFGTFVFDQPARIYIERVDSNPVGIDYITVTDKTKVPGRPFETTITNSGAAAVHALSVNYTATETASAGKTMTLTVDGEEYIYTLPALTAGETATEVFYVRLLSGENTVAVAADEAFAVTGIAAESKAEAIYQAETDATMVSGERKPNASNCTYIWNNVQLKYNMVYPTGTYNIKVNGASVWASRIKVKILDMDGNVLSESAPTSLGYIGGMRLPEEGEFALVDLGTFVLDQPARIYVERVDSNPVGIDYITVTDCTSDVSSASKTVKLASVDTEIIGVDPTHFVATILKVSLDEGINTIAFAPAAGVLTDKIELRNYHIPNLDEVFSPEQGIYEVVVCEEKVTIDGQERAISKTAVNNIFEGDRKRIDIGMLVYFEDPQETNAVIAAAYTPEGRMTDCQLIYPHCSSPGLYHMGISELETDDASYIKVMAWEKTSTMVPIGSTVVIGNQ